MSNPTPKLRNLFLALFGAIALLLIFDFVWPGQIVNAHVEGIQSEYEQYYNAAQNYHYSYMVFTKEHAFPVTETFAESVKKGELVELSISVLFNQVNWYRLNSSESKSVYSLRLVAGLVAPLLALITFFFAYRYKRNISTLIFVFQTVLLADLILTIVY